jgi:hypothetical protein
VCEEAVQGYSLSHRQAFLDVGDHAAGRISTQAKTLPAFREDMDGHFVALIDRLDEVLFRELEDGTWPSAG